MEEINPLIYIKGEFFFVYNLIFFSLIKFEEIKNSKIKRNFLKTKFYGFKVLYIP